MEVRKIKRKSETQRKKYCKMQIKRTLIMRKKQNEARTDRIKYSNKTEGRKEEE